MRSSFKTGLLLAAATLASLGCLPYGIQFAELLKPFSHFFYAIALLIFPLTVCLANIALGVFSFFNSRRHKSTTQYPVTIDIISLLSALPLGCICYFAYYQILPPLTTWIMTLATVLINAAIAHSAVMDFLSRFRLKRYQSLAKQELIFRVVGFFIGFSVSLTAYMASIHVLTGFFSVLFQVEQSAAYHLACFFGLISWLPYSLLFANSTQITAGIFYQFMTRFRHYFRNWDLSRFSLALFALFSGTSFSQMTLVFFGPDRTIPLFLKGAEIQHYIHVILVPLALLSSASVNFIALENILLERKKGLVGKDDPGLFVKID